jgi:hypothetical protein
VPAQSPLFSEVAAIADSAGSMEQRAQALLEPLRREVPYAAAWIAVRDPETRRHRPVAREGDTEPLARYFALPEADDELERLGLNRLRPPVRACDLPVPLPEIRAWGDYLLPAGFRDGVALALFSEDGRHVGFLSLLSDERAQRTAAYSDVVGRLRPLLARTLDRVPSLTALARLAGDAEGAGVLSHGGRCLPVPGLPQHPLLAVDSPVVAVARRHVGAPGAHSSFLCPSADGQVRITVLDCRDETADHLTALVLVRPAGDLSGLAPAELELLGALLEGWDHEDIRGRCGVAHVAAHVDDMARRLGRASVDALLLHVAREGLYVPPPLWTRCAVRTPAAVGMRGR